MMASDRKQLEKLRDRIDNIDTAHKETFSDWINISFKETIKKLQSKWGDDPGNWQWGKMHKLLLRHPLGRHQRI